MTAQEFILQGFILFLDERIEQERLILVILYTETLESLLDFCQVLLTPRAFRGILQLDHLKACLPANKRKAATTLDIGYKKIAFFLEMLHKSQDILIPLDDFVPDVPDARLEQTGALFPSPEPVIDHASDILVHGSRIQDKQAVGIIVIQEMEGPEVPAIREGVVFPGPPDAGALIALQAIPLK